MGKAISIGLFIVSIMVLFTLSLGERTHLSTDPGPTPSPAPNPELWSSGMNYPLTAQLVITGGLLVAALFEILTKKYPAQDKQGALGTVVGFWLKAPA
jgi:hypothetical protein